MRSLPTKPWNSSPEGRIRSTHNSPHLNNKKSGKPCSTQVESCGSDVPWGSRWIHPCMAKHVTTFLEPTLDDLRSILLPQEKRTYAYTLDPSPLSQQHTRLKRSYPKMGVEKTQIEEIVVANKGLAQQSRGCVVDYSHGPWYSPHVFGLRIKVANRHLAQ